MATFFLLFDHVILLNEYRLNTFMIYPLWVYVKNKQKDMTEKFSIMSSCLLSYYFNKAATACVSSTALSAPAITEP